MVRKLCNMLYFIMAWYAGWLGFGTSFYGMNGLMLNYMDFIDQIYVNVIVIQIYMYVSMYNLWIIVRLINVMASQMKMFCFV